MWSISVTRSVMWMVTAVPPRYQAQFPVQMQGVKADHGPAQIHVVSVVRRPLLMTGCGTARRSVRAIGRHGRRFGSPVWPRSTCADRRSSISLATMPAAMPQSRSVETVTKTVW